jgi:hypothetical protein
MYIHLSLADHLCGRKRGRDNSQHQFGIDAVPDWSRTQQGPQTRRALLEVREWLVAVSAEPPVGPALGASEASPRLLARRPRGSAPIHRRYGRALRLASRATRAEPISPCTRDGEGARDKALEIRRRHALAWCQVRNRLSKVDLIAKTSVAAEQDRHYPNARRRVYLGRRCRDLYGQD